MELSAVDQPCPNHPETTIATKRVGPRLVYYCDHGCNHGQIIGKLGHSVNGTNGHTKAASATAAALAGPELPTPNPAPAEPFPLGEKTRQWKDRLRLNADSEIQRGAQDVDRLVNALIPYIDLPLYRPPGVLSDTDVHDELIELAERALREWRIDNPVVDQPEEPDDDDVLKPMDLRQLYDYVDEWDRQPWIWEGILPRSSLSLIVGKSETGKSTLIYGLIHAIAKGLTFFGRRCAQGKIIYLAADPLSEVVAGKTFRKLGLDPADGVMVIPGALASNPSGFSQLRRIVESYRPDLIVGDTLAATVRLDTDKYGQSQEAQQPLVKLARKYTPNFLMSHHSQKSAIDTYSVIDGALGSVGVAAVASTRMMTRMHRRNKDRFYTFEMSNLRIGEPIEGEWIVKRYDNGLMELDSLWNSQQVAMDSDLILKVLEEQREPISERTLWNEVLPKPKWGAFKTALRELVAQKIVKAEKNKRQGGGKRYSLVVGSSEPPTSLYQQN